MAMNMPNRTEQGTWVQGCPTCKADIRVKNCALVRVGGECDNCRGWENEPDDSDQAIEHGASVELGFCACGNPENIDRLVFTYLRHRDHGPDDWPATAFPPEWSDDLGLLVAYLVDTMGWTEHGGGIYGCWLTDDGKEAMANLASQEGRWRI